jgi:hypothetical protein
VLQTRQDIGCARLEEHAGDHRGPAVTLSRRTPEGPADGGGLKVFPFVACAAFVRPSRELAERFPTVPWASASSHALAVLTCPTWHLMAVTVAGAPTAGYQSKINRCRAAAKLCRAAANALSGEDRPKEGSTNGEDGTR